MAHKRSSAYKNRVANLPHRDPLFDPEPLYNGGSRRCMGFLSRFREKTTVANEEEKATKAKREHDQLMADAKLKAASKKRGDTFRRNHAPLDTKSLTELARCVVDEIVAFQGSPLPAAREESSLGTAFREYDGTSEATVCQSSGRKEARLQVSDLRGGLRPSAGTGARGHFSFFFFFPKNPKQEFPPTIASFFETLNCKNGIPPCNGTSF
jgi:hypothetical protein